jgi:phosphatidate cytidylyltransferase
MVGVAAVGTLALVAALLWSLRSAPSLGDWGATAGAAVLAGGLLAYGPLLRGLDQGREWVFLVVFVTFAADTSAFFVGRAIGNRPLAPKTSPGKTWEGAVGGLLGAMGAGVALTQVLGLDMTVAAALALGALMGVVGQLGDLGESWIKRAAGIKDSGWLIPGHGGVLDRLDSIVFNLVLVYHFTIWATQ